MKKLFLSLLISVLLATPVYAAVTNPPMFVIESGNYMPILTTPDLGKSGRTMGDIYAGTLNISGITLTGNLDLDGNSLIMDTDGDTSLTADTDDQIDIEIGGADDFQFTANTFTALSGSDIDIAEGRLTIADTADELMFDADNTMSGSLSSSTTNRALIKSSRTESSGGTWTDNFDTAYIFRQTGIGGPGAGSLTVQGSALKIENSSFANSGTVNDTVSVLELVQDVDSNGHGIDLWMWNAPGIGGTGNAINISSIGTGQLINATRAVTNANHNNEANIITITSIVDDAGTYTKSGPAFDIISNVTETSGTITDTSTVLGLSQTHADATGDVVTISNSGTGNDITGNAGNWFITPAGNATFNNIVGNISFAETTVGTGGQYADVQAAIDGGEDNIIIISNVTEDSDVVVPATGLTIRLRPNVTHNMQANQFTFAGAYPFTLIGSGYSSVIQYAYTTGTDDLISANTSSTVLIQNLTIDNNSSGGTTSWLIDTGPFKVSDVRFELPGRGQAGIKLNSSGAQITNSEFIGLNSSTGVGLILTTGVASNLTFTGTWSASSPIVDSQGQFITASNFRFITVGKIEIDGNWSNIIAGSSALDVTVVGHNASLTNAYLGTQGDIDVGIFTEFMANNVFMRNLDMTDASASRNHFSNCEVLGTTVTFGGDQNIFSNCSFALDIVISSGADDNTFGLLRVGAEGGAGAGTITINAGANRTIVGNSRTDAAISDSGTDSAIANNVTY